jgi:single-stranded DNA-binding protein
LPVLYARPTRLAVSGGEANSDVEWQDQSGQDKYTTEVVLHSIGSLLCSTGPEKVSSRANAISMSVSYR